MIIKAGQYLIVKHKRKGTFYGIAIEDFETPDEWYPIAVMEENVKGLNRNWILGDTISCKAELCEIELIDKINVT